MCDTDNRYVYTEVNRCRHHMVKLSINQRVITLPYTIYRMLCIVSPVMMTLTE